MTVRELANFCGKTEKCIRNWCTKASEKNSEISEKISNAYKTKKQTDFSIDEVELILQSSSMSKDAVSILMENARNQKQVTTEFITKDDLQLFAKELVTETMKQVIPLITSQTMQLVNKINNSTLQIEQDYFSIKAYANKIGEKITFSEAKGLGKRAVELSKEKGLEVKKVDDERFGYVNSYHINVLKEIFAI